MPAQFAAIVLTASPPGTPADSAGSSVKIDGREALLRSVELFLNRENIEQVIVVFQPDALDEGKRKHGNHFGFTGVRVVAGGPRWLEQIDAAMPLISADVTHVLVHDGARPAVPYTDLEALMNVAETHESAALTGQIRSALLELDEADLPVGYRGGNEFVQLLTPQVFSKGRLARAMGEKSLPHASELHMVPGSPVNIRLNGLGDAGLAKAMIGLLPKPKVKAQNNPFEEAQW